MFEDIGGIINYLGWIIAALIIIWIFSMGIRIVRPLERGLIERLGKYRRFAQPGFHWLIPIVDRMYKINITERMMDVNPQEVITKDNLNAKVDLMIYYKVGADEERVKKSIYSVDKFQTQIVSLAQTTARNVIGTMVFKEVNSERNRINTELKKTLDVEADAWGVSIVRVEMKEIVPPSDVQDTMNKVLKAENEKVAAIDFATATETQADGQRRAQIKQAEGIKQARILEAEGQASAIKKVADANSYQIEVVNQSIQKNFRGQAEIYKKLETVQNSLKDNTKFVIDPNTAITNVIAESMAGIIPLSSKKEPDQTVTASAIDIATSDTGMMEVKSKSSKTRARM
jgi:regulator of protease activity HflC (stomatin/prohibitin superfamily)